MIAVVDAARRLVSGNHGFFVQCISFSALAPLYSAVGGKIFLLSDLCQFAIYTLQFTIKRCAKHKKKCLKIWIYGKKFVPLYHQNRTIKPYGITVKPPIMTNVMIKKEFATAMYLVAHYLQLPESDWNDNIRANFYFRLGQANIYAKAALIEGIDLDTLPYIDLYEYEIKLWRGIDCVAKTH